MFQGLLFGLSIIVLALIFGFIASCLSGDITLSETLLPIRSSVLFSFLKKLKKKRGRGEEIAFFQISFLKKKIKKEGWRKLFETCWLECRDAPSDKIFTERYMPPCKFFAGRKEERKEFREFWKNSSISSSLDEREREWLKEMEKNVERKEENCFLRIEG